MAGTESNSNTCSVCERHADTRLCPLCSSLVSNKKSSRWNHLISNEIHQDGRDLLGGSGRTAKQRWNHLLLQTAESEDVSWARLPSDSDPVVSSPGTQDQLEKIIQSLCEGVRLNVQQRNLLLDGFLLHDGVRISFLENKLLVNGRSMPFEIPTASFLSVITSPKTRCGWDLTKLFSIFGTLNIGYTRREHEQRHPWRGRQIPHLQKPGADALFRWIEWMAEEHLMPPEHYTLNPVGAWARDVKRKLSGPNGHNNYDEYIVDAFRHHPPGLRGLSDYPWMNRWISYMGTTQSTSDRPWPFAIEGRRLKLKVRTRKNATRNTPVPAQPGVWAFLLSSILSPLTSKAGELLFAIQFNWSDQSSNVLNISEPLRRSIHFLNEVIDGNSNRIHVHKDRILVVGRLGHFYEVRVGKGVHSAPFIIEAIRSLEPRRTSNLCIHDGTFHSTVPLGDTIATVLLSLLDDINTSVRVDSLAVEIHALPPLGFPLALGDEHLRLLNRVNLESLIDTVKAGRQHISWLPPSLRSSTNAHARRYGNFGVLFGRNLEFNERERANEENLAASRTKALIRHALAAGRPPPYPQFIEMWHTSVDAYDGLDSSSRHVDRLYRRIRGRQDWMFLRNFAQDQTEYPIGDVREGERRYCEIFPSIWEAMMLQPIGSTLRISELDRGVIDFQHCHLKLTVRHTRERRMLSRFAELLGYEERGVTDGMIRYERTAAPRNNARRDLTLLLNRSQVQLGTRGAPPWWWHYRDVAEAPAQLPRIRWELEQDYADDIGR
jgi:hypothetical protein